VRQLLPEAVDPVDPLVVYGDLPAAGGRPSVRLNMIASLDGAISVAGRSGALGGPADKELFHVLRSLADVVLVGAGTVRAERYGPAQVPIAVVSRSCGLDWGAPFFTEQKARPIVITVTGAPDDLRARAAEVADVVIAGDDDVDLARAVGALGDRGMRSVLCEGGPTLNTQLVAADLVDELCLTVSPHLVGGDGPRLLAGAGLADVPRLNLRGACEADGFLFLRFRP
jgi:riboflavin biosynthesis pyrimidine reductase